MPSTADQDEDFPVYSYVPGGPWPHPTRSSDGQSAHERVGEDAVIPLCPSNWSSSRPYMRGIRLFNAGYYWEAHECWEALWHVHGRTGPTADFLRALIKLAAAGVKVRERRPLGVTTHARRAAELLAMLQAQVGRTLHGLDLAWLEAHARRLEDRPPEDPGRRTDPVVLVFAFALDPRDPEQSGTASEP